MSNNIATELILSAKEQLDKAIASATSKIELLDNLLKQGIGEEQLKEIIKENIEDGTIGNAIFNKENIVNTKNLVDGSVTNSKIGGQLNTYTTKNATTRFKEINVMDININTTDNTISYNTKRTGSIYVNNTNPTIVKANQTKSVPLKNSTTFVLAYNPITNSLNLDTYGYSLQTCIILAYIYYYNSNLVRLCLCGNDNSIAVYRDGTRLYDMQTEQSIFNHTANSKASVWNDWTTSTGKVGGGVTTLDKTTAPVPFAFNSSVYATNGMFVAKAGDTNTWNSYDNFLGGHMIQLFAKDKSYRGTFILDDRIDTLPVLAIQSWITCGSGHMAFGWVHLGADSAGRIDEVSKGKETGVYFNPKVTINNTPTIMKPQPLITTMPMQYELNEDGTYKLDSNNQKISKEAETIDGKDILQVNESNELCFHSAKDNKWYKINMTEITE